MRSEMQLIRAADSVVLPLFSSPVSGTELLTILRELISSTWGIDNGTSDIYAVEAVLAIEAKMHLSPVTDRGRGQGGLGICRMRKVAKFVDANLHNRISVLDLACLVKLSSSQFQRAFKQSFGEATHMYIIKQRVVRAKAMLTTSDISAAQIALACGFSDQSHMTRLFTRLVGESPCSWRRNRL
ncbi:helix-turn-helix domain-containing protein [Candidatus Phyllobacterium onerii]|uniref:helix-turn-helix domain-containing protein n=1 Tax=Candidatus Phyllobacterium onerii TaxID=3020828 RepID=UPI00232E120E|nr:AraC family transcriptional regulator [Phyllobacterium sp. IY22]